MNRNLSITIVTVVALICGTITAVNVSSDRASESDPKAVRFYKACSVMGSDIMRSKCAEMASQMKD